MVAGNMGYPGTAGGTAGIGAMGTMPGIGAYPAGGGRGRAGQAMLSSHQGERHCR